LPLWFASRARCEELNRQVVQYRESVENEASKKEEESKILQSLSPITKTVDEMKKKMEYLEREREGQYRALGENIKNAYAQTESLRNTTNALATALKSNQARGQWGEIEMRRIVESTGMSEHVSFDVQVSGNNNESRPDMIIYLPGGRTIILDSKAPMGDYLEASAISDLASEAELIHKKSLIKKSAQAVKIQIDNLASKKYQEIWDCPDFVIMFMPSEAMLSSVLEAEPAMLEYAFGKKVALASPVSLFSVLKTVAYTWGQDSMAKNALELGELSKELLKRVGVMAKHSDEMAVALGKATLKYNEFAKSLERNVLTQANRIARRLEAQEIEEPRRLGFEGHEFSKGELLDATAENTDALRANTD
ncbi:MAG: DNA recombination protein RmuC, partial [Oscillospiraceae bacterium]|nr:DNA recombination protein RmuC [Oscillospiraceae bacterium]